MTGDRQLSELFERLRRASPAEASPRCEQALRRAVRTFPARRRSAAWKYWTAVAACLALIFGALFVRRPVPPVRKNSPFADFVPLPYGQGDVPLEHSFIVRVDLPPSGAHRQADLLIGQDGVARAVRLVQ